MYVYGQGGVQTNKLSACKHRANTHIFNVDINNPCLT